MCFDTCVWVLAIYASCDVRLLQQILFLVLLDIPADHLTVATLSNVSFWIQRSTVQTLAASLCCVLEQDT